MDTNFWNMLQLGRTTEQRAAQYFKDKGFEVWGIGSYRLPIDLLVWNNLVSFWVQVKYRSTSPWIVLHKETLEKIRDESNYPILLFLEYKDQFFLLPTFPMDIPEGLKTHIPQFTATSHDSSFGSRFISIIPRKLHLEERIAETKKDLAQLEEEYEVVLCSER